MYWKGYTHKDRNIAIYEIENLVNKYGSITDFHMFSDMEINLTIEIEEQKINKLYVELRDYLDLDNIGDLNPASTTERSVSLNITFLKSSGNLRIEVPNVPG